MFQFYRGAGFVLTRASEGVAQGHILRTCHSHYCNLSSDCLGSDCAPESPKPPTNTAPTTMMVRPRQNSRTVFMPRTRAPDGCGREREPKSECDIPWRSTGRSPRA